MIEITLSVRLQTCFVDFRSDIYAASFPEKDHLKSSP